MHISQLRNLIASHSPINRATIEDDARNVRLPFLAPPLEPLSRQTSSNELLDNIPLGGLEGASAAKTARHAERVFPLPVASPEARRLVKSELITAPKPDDDLMIRLLELDKMEIVLIHAGLTLHLEFQEKDLKKLYKLREVAREKAKELSEQLRRTARLDKMHMSISWMSGLLSFVAGIIACATGVGALPGGAMIISGCAAMSHTGMSQFGGYRAIVESASTGTKEHKEKVISRIETAFGWTTAGLSIGTTVIGGGFANAGSAVVKVLGSGEMLITTVGALADGVKAWGDSRAKLCQERSTLARAVAEAADNRTDTQDELQHMMRAWQRFLARAEKARHQNGNTVMQIAKRIGLGS